MKVTPWFPADVKPVRKGFYEATAMKFYSMPPMCFWDGKKWLRFDKKSDCIFQTREWRGLAEKPKAKS